MRILLMVFFGLLGSFPTIGQDYWEQKDSVNGPPKASASAFSLGSIGMVVAGLDEVEFKRKSYVYSPFQDDWDETTSLGGAFGDGLQRASACGFSIENNGVIKGYIALGQAQTVPYLNDLWEFDPVTEAWSQKADFIGQPRRQAVAFVVSGKAYVGTGEGTAGLLNDFYVYDNQTNTWDQIADFEGTARRQAIAFSLAGNGFVGTGDDGTKRNDFWMYNPQTDQWILKAQFPGMARSGACAWSNYPTAFVGTGEGSDYSYLKDLYEYNYYTNSWAQRANLPGPPRKNAIAFCLNGVGYIGTGYNNEFLDDFYAYYQLVGVNDIQGNEVSIYPNPAQDFVYVHSPNEVIQSILIINSLGDVIQEIKGNQLEKQLLNMQQFPSGSYHISVEFQSSKTFQTTFSKL